MDRIETEVKIHDNTNEKCKGLIAVFYPVQGRAIGFINNAYVYSYSYPFQTVGIILILVGIVFVGLGLFY
jgi:hypothetical protein